MGHAEQGIGRPRRLLRVNKISATRNSHYESPTSHKASRYSYSLLPLDFSHFQVLHFLQYRRWAKMISAADSLQSPIPYRVRTPYPATCR